MQAIILIPGPGLIQIRARWNTAILLWIEEARLSEDFLMPEYEEFRRRAMYCVTLAGTIFDPGHKAALLEMAERWRQLADEARDRTETSTPR